MILRTLIFLGLFFGNINASSYPESDDPLVTIQDWTGQHFPTHAAGLLKEMGYNVEIVVSDAITQIQLLREISTFPLKFGLIMLVIYMMAWYKEILL